MRLKKITKSKKQKQAGHTSLHGVILLLVDELGDEYIEF